MEKIQLLPFLEIQGIGAASGLVYQEDQLYIISDNSTYLYLYNIPQDKLSKIPLTENPEENIIKKDKPDFETLTLFDNKLYLFGSGSTRKRNTSVTFNLRSKVLKEKNLSNLYKNFIKLLSIANNDLNIEGVIITAETTYFFQRGNGKDAQNGVFCYDKKSKTVQFNPVVLPEINRKAATFTDAVLVDDKIYFLAAAEDTTSTYDDGEILGSYIGCMDAITLKVEFTQQISNTHKFEGVTLYKKTATQLELLLCEDKDSEVLTSTIYRLIIN